MNPELERIFENTPDDSRRSKLEPYRELILRWRRQGRSYRRICLLLQQNFNLQMNSGALFRFVKRRSRPRKPQPNLEPAEAVSSAQIPLALPQKGSTAEPGQGRKMTAEERAAQTALRQSLIAKSQVKPVETKRKLYEFGWDQQSTREEKKG